MLTITKAQAIGRRWKRETAARKFDSKERYEILTEVGSSDKAKEASGAHVSDREQEGISAMIARPSRKS